jgi:hypothetical protein
MRRDEWTKDHGPDKKKSGAFPIYDILAPVQGLWAELLYFTLIRR